MLVNVSLLFLLRFECFSEIFKNITHVLYEEKRPCKAGRNVYMREKRPSKVGSLLGEIIYFHINRF